MAHTRPPFARRWFCSIGLGLALVAGPVLTRAETPDPQKGGPVSRPDADKLKTGEAAKPEGQKPDAPKPEGQPKPDAPKPAVIIKRVKPGEGGELLKVEGGEIKPDKKKPAPVAAKVAPEAQALLDKVTAAYQALTGLELAGSISADIKVGGQEQPQRAEFTATFSAPNKFRHEVKDDIVVGSTGTQVYSFRPVKNDYKTAEAPKGRVPADKIPSPARELLQQQDPGLLCALVDDAGKFLLEDVKEVSKAADVTIDGKAYPALAFKAAKESYTVALDPTTHLVRRIVVDLRDEIKSAGRDDVERFALTFDYTSIKPDARPTSDAFAWAAPEGAKDQAAVEAEEGDAMALLGKPAPDFTLNGMDGKPVSLKDQRGQVVILDFWATWCGPCRASLPGLNKLHKELAPKGLVTFAIDLEEPKDTIAPVAAKLCPDLTVLLDEKGETSKKFGVSGIPQTVVVGKDGKVRKVFIGSGNEARIKAEVEKALKD